MANDFEVQVETTAPADVAWALAGDPGRIDEWFAPVVSVAVTGDQRRAVMANGAEIVEDLVDRDDHERRYSYVVRSGIPGLTSHKATIRVEARGTGSLIAWRQTATSDDPAYDIESRLRGVMTRGLETLRDQLDAGF
jgi:hypothetical protein